MDVAMTDKELVEMLQKQFELRNTKVSGLQQITTELEGVNRRLLESEDVKSRFLSNIRNEINNPMAVVIGASAHLMTIDNLDSAHLLGKMIYRESQNLNFQMENIFMAAELEAGDDSLTFLTVNIESIIEDVLDSLRDVVEEKQISIVRTYKEKEDADSHPFFRTDKQKIAVVLENLLHNAMKFCDENKSVTIDFSITPNGLMLAISDEGIGIAPEDHALVFDRFRQLDEGLLKGHAGQGLGLCITKAIVDVLGGTITIDSSLGEGASFIIQIPDCSAEEDADFDGKEEFFDAGAGDVEMF